MKNPTSAPTLRTPCEAFETALAPLGAFGAGGGGLRKASSAFLCAVRRGSAGLWGMGKLALLAWLASFALSAQAQTGPTCDSRFWLSQSDELLAVGTTTNPFTYSNYLTFSANVNAVDINPTDGKLYGVYRGTRNLFSVDSAGTVTNLGAVTGLPTGVTYNSGAFSNSGNVLYVHDDGGSAMYAIDVTTSPPTATAIPFSTITDVSDIAWYDGYLWGVRDNGRLVRISTSGTVTPIGTNTLPTTSSSYGAMMGASNGLFAVNNSDGKVYQVDTVDGGGTLLSGSPPSSGNDGAHCPTQPFALGANLGITKTNTPASGPNDLAGDKYVGGQTRTYSIVIRNTGPFGVADQNARDVLPSGITAASYTCTASAGSNCGTAASGSVSGASQINWSGIGLPVNGSVTILVTLTVPVSYTDTLVNTATVLPTTTVIENTPSNNEAVDSDIGPSADLAITKTNNLPGTVDLANDTLTRGQTTVYRIVVTNNGPDAVTGAVVRDIATGLTCTGLTCSSSPASPSSCPSPAPTATQLLSPAGVTLLALPVGGSVSMDLTCTVN